MISTYELELFAKQAATDYLKDGKSLTESITKIASDNGLNREQIRRVVEAANTDTYISLHNKSNDKYISFETADPLVIEENVTGTKVAEASVVDDSDYYDAPAYEAPTYEAVKVAEAETPQRSAEQELRDYYQFKAAEAQLDNMMIESQLAFSNEAEKLGLMIKQAVLGGTNYSEIRAALNSNTDPIFVETLNAIETELTPVMPLGALTKTAATVKGSVNARHPLVQQSLKIVKLASEYKVLSEKKKELESEWNLYKQGGAIKATTSFIANHPKSFLMGLGIGVGGTALAIPAIAKHTAAREQSPLHSIPEMYRG